MTVRESGGDLRTVVSKRLTGSRRGVLTILAGTAVGQILAVLSAPALSRLYGPADLGVLTVVTALATPLSNIAALRLELAIPLPAKERDAYSLVFLGLLSCVATIVVGLLIVATFGDDVARLFEWRSLHLWLWSVPMIAAAMAAFRVLNQFAIRHRRYVAVGRRNLLQSVTMVLTQLGAGAARAGPAGLVVGLGVGQLAGAVSLLHGAGLRTTQAREGRSIRRMRHVIRTYRRFPLLLTPAGLLNVLGLQLPVLLIAWAYGGEVAGWLGLTQRVLALPVTLIGQAVAQVYLGELSLSVRQGTGRAQLLFSKVSKRLTIFSILGAGILLALGPTLFSVVFGARWTTSGQYAQALALALAAQLIAVPLSQTLIVMGHQGQQLAWDASRLVLTTGAVWLCIELRGPAIAAVWTMGIALTVTYSASWLLSRLAVRSTN